MTMQNKRIVVTRAPHQAMKLVDLLRERGAVPLIFPCIDIVPPDNCSPFDSALRNISNYEWLVVTSSNTVLAMKRRLQSLQIQPDLRAIKIAAVGQNTADAMYSMFGTHPSLIPDKQSAEGLADVMGFHETMTVFLPQSGIAKQDLAQALTEQGASVNVVEAYKTVIGHGGEDIPQMLKEKRVDAVTFTSPSTVENFIKRIEPVNALNLPAACIGSTTSDAASGAGFSTIITPEHFALEDMVQALEQYFEDQE